MKNRFMTSAMASAVLFAGAGAMADVSVVWTAPANGTVYPVGTLVNPVGAATATGSIGGTGGLDLALVLDSSGSMTTSNSPARPASNGNARPRPPWSTPFPRAAPRSQ